MNDVAASHPNRWLRRGSRKISPDLFTEDKSILITTVAWVTKTQLHALLAGCSKHCIILLKLSGKQKAGNGSPASYATAKETA